ncbi:hypothetical protein F5Y00DRAFT_10122 [Daldinia vernicosa]|uniref:uncharacterized protein n=1 Tax=Daldinia vernicosa TaxID=114800 RepID=UPI0020081F88|nr:uncharacterized protein F5Y00DRAFT_10122 [Daldinia vernicosa]KAI0851470.1 hypothetical protein F5Y00DRAFT_10122 [Daldinia vernicosa]
MQVLDVPQIPRYSLRYPKMNNHLTGKTSNSISSNAYNPYQIHTHMLPVEVPEVHVALFMVALRANQSPPNRRDAGGFANSSSHQMWSVCSLQVSLFLHLFLSPMLSPFPSSLSLLLILSIHYGDRLLYLLFFLFLLKLGILAVVPVERQTPCRATHLCHTFFLQGRLIRIPPLCAALGASPSRSQNFFLPTTRLLQNIKDIEAMHICFLAYSNIYQCSLSNLPL